jgi:predicted nucleic acid-binding protein
MVRKGSRVRVSFRASLKSMRIGLLQGDVALVGPLVSRIAAARSSFELPAGYQRPLPVIDGLLAATARVLGLTLVTCNIADVGCAGHELLDPFAGYVSRLI